MEASRGIPLLLPADVAENIEGGTALRILVQTLGEAAATRTLISSLAADSEKRTDLYTRRYHSRLASALIIPIERAAERLAQNDANWAKIETIPASELF